MLVTMLIIISAVIAVLFVIGALVTGGFALFVKGLCWLFKLGIAMFMIAVGLVMLIIFFL